MEVCKEKIDGVTFDQQQQLRFRTKVEFMAHKEPLYAHGNQSIRELVHIAGHTKS